MEDSEVISNKQALTAPCVHCGSTDTLLATGNDVIRCGICSAVLCLQCFSKHEHACDCCGKPEHHVHCDHCTTCGKLSCRACIYTHPCPFPFKAKNPVSNKPADRRADVLDGEFAAAEREERAGKLASELWFAILAVGENPSVTGPTLPRLSEDARVAMLTEAAALATLNAISCAQKAYSEADLRQFVAAFSKQLTFSIAISAKGREDEDEDTRRSNIRTEFERLLLLRYKQYGGTSLGVLDRVYVRLYSALLGRCAWDEVYLKAMIKEDLGRDMVRVPTPVLDTFVKLALAEINTINAEFFNLSK